MNKRILIILTVAALALPATAGLFGPKGDSTKEKRAKDRKAPSSVQAAQFLQIENQINSFIDMTIAAETPLVGESAQ